MKIVIAGGGTGGHIFPAIALAEELKKGGEVIFVGTGRGLEARVVPSRGYRMERLDVEGLKGKKGRSRAKALKKAALATLRSIALLRKLAPTVVIGCGGYSSGPVVLGARILGIKTAILEQNAVAGLTNRILGRFVNRIYLAFEEAAGHFPKAHTVVTGNPVRKDIAENKKQTGKGKFTVLVFGGSQGAVALNAAFLDAAEYLTDIWGDLRVLHQTGPKAFAPVEAAYRRKGITAELHGFIDDMAGAYGACDLVVCRAGATSIAEITAAGLPSILVPYPFSADAHQEANASVIAEKGAAIMIRQHELTGLRLAEVIRGLFKNPVELKKMKEAAARLARPGAARAIAEDIGRFLN